MNLMKPVWDEGLVTLSRSMKGVTGRPSNFSTSLWGQKRRKYNWVQVCCFFRIPYSDWPGCKTPAGDSPARAPPPPWAGPHWICHSLWSESSSAACTTWKTTHWCHFSDHDGIKPNPLIHSSMEPNSSAASQTLIPCFIPLSPHLCGPCWRSQRSAGWTWTCWESRCVWSCQWPEYICR